MPTVRLRDASEYPEAARKLFELSKAWFNYDDIIKAWRDADSINGVPYGIPYDGEVTVQVYRKDLYDAKGLKPADTYDQLVANAKALTDPSARTTRRFVARPLTPARPTSDGSATAT